MSARPLLNVDLGELPDEPEALYALAHLANLACGGHAGDADSLARALERCARLGARAGAHPSYEDRAHFGRVRLELPPEAVREQVRAQCARLAGAARRAGVPVGHLKPHGALYHAADADPALAAAVLDGAAEALGPLTVLGPPGGALSRAAAARDLPFLREGFADRGLRPDGSLVPRTEPGALLHDPAAAAAQAVRLWRAGRADTLCVHGDSPGALATARAVRAALDAEAPR